MSEASEGQARTLIASFAVDIPWGEIPKETIQPFIQLTPRQRGQRFAEFLRNGGKVLVGEPKVITINRGRFSSRKFIGDNWFIVSDETDTRSTKLTELDFTKIKFVTMLSDGEIRIKGEEKLKRLKSSNYIRLDADIFLTLWENPHLIPESWKERGNRNARFIFFDGTVIRSPGGDRYVPYLSGDAGAWDHGLYSLGNVWYDNYPSAVLAQ